MLLDLLEDFTGEDNDRGGTVANFGVLRSGNVDEDAGGGVNNVEELRRIRDGLKIDFPQTEKALDTNLHDGSAVVGNGLLAILIDHEQIATVGTESRLYRGLHGETGIDVGNDLTLALGCVGACKRIAG